MNCKRLGNFDFVKSVDKNLGTFVMELAYFFILNEILCLVMKLKSENLLIGLSKDR